MILRIASSRIVGQGDIVGRSGYFSLNLSANSVMRGRLDARRTLKSLVADLRIIIFRDYIQHKQRLGFGIAPENYFFVKCNDTSISSRAVSYNFNLILERAGIMRNKNRKGPRLHDLRHTFCVNSFVKLCESGRDIYNAMLILMTYMGHQSIAATNKYVRVVENMFPQIVKQMEATNNEVFPEMTVYNN